MRWLIYFLFDVLDADDAEIGILGFRSCNHLTMPILHGHVITGAAGTPQCSRVVGTYVPAAAWLFLTFYPNVLTDHAETIRAWTNRSR
jgi:hypothetical protein